MYDVINTYVKLGFQWEEVDVRLQTIGEIRKYQNVRITVTSDEDITRDFFTSVNSALLAKASTASTLAEWIQSLDEGSLITTDKARGLVDANVVDFVDLFSFASEIKSGNYLYGEGVHIPEGMDVDIRFTTYFTSRESFHIDKIQSTCLFAVNGLIYPSARRDDNIFILNGNERLKFDTDQTISTINFGDIGTIESVPINTNRLTALTRTSDDISRRRSRFKITLDEAIGTRIPILVMDGYLHIMNDTMTQVDVDTFVVTVEHDLALRRCAKKPRYSRDWIDYGNMEQLGFNINSFDAEKYMLSPCTFLVLLDTEDFSMFKEPVGHTDIPGVYHHYRVPRGMMFFDDGRLAPYYIKDYNEWNVALYTIDSSKSKSMFDLTYMDTATSFGVNTYSEKFNNYHRAYVLELYSFA